MVGFAAAISLLLRHWGAIEKYTQGMAQSSLTAPLLQVRRCLCLYDCLVKHMTACLCSVCLCAACLLSWSFGLAIENNMHIKRFVDHSDTHRHISARPCMYHMFVNFDIVMVFGAEDETTLC